MNHARGPAKAILCAIVSIAYMMSPLVIGTQASTGVATGQDGDPPSRDARTGDGPAIALAGNFRMPFAGFVRNAGQIPNVNIALYATSAEFRFGFATSAVLIVVPATDSPEAGARVSRMKADDSRNPGGSSRVLLRLTFDGANPVVPMGRGELPHRSNFLLGNDPSKWVQDVRSYREVAYENLYQGIDLVYQVTPEGLKYEFHLRPGADLDDVRIHYSGVVELAVTREGLELTTVLGTVRDTSPVAFQDSTPISCGFFLAGTFSVGIRCNGWDPTKPLVVDPLVYATFLGGSSYEDSFGSSLVTDAAGNTIVTGQTASVDFPTTAGAFDTSQNGGADVFVAKLNPGGNALLFSTFIGGSNTDIGRAVALDSSEIIYLSGITASSDFPTTPGAYDTTFNGDFDAFVAKLSPSGGTLLFSTYLGGTNIEYCLGIGVDEIGEPTVAGTTSSSDFPTTSGAYDQTYNGNSDVYVTKLSVSGSSLLFSTYVGGSQWEDRGAIAVDSAGNSFVAGQTRSPDFPVTPGAYDTSYNGNGDAFVFKLNPQGNVLVYSTFLGGAGLDSAVIIAVDDDGAAAVVGEDASSTFPTTPGAFDTTWNGGREGFVTKLSPSGNSLTFSSFLGGSGDDSVYGASLDPDGSIFLTGSTTSSDFPTTSDAFDPSYNGGYDAFVAKLNPQGSSLVYSTFFGGSGPDNIYPGEMGDSIHVADSGCDTVTPSVIGGTQSLDFPTTSGAYDTSYNGGRDDFVARFSFMRGGRDTLVLEKSKEWYVTSSTLALAVFAGDVDGDGQIEIVTGGTRDAEYTQQANLRIWTWDGCTLSLKAEQAWPPSGPFPGGAVESVTAADLDGNSLTDIVTAGYLYRNGIPTWDVEVWRSTGSSIVQEAVLDPPVGFVVPSIAYSVQVQDTDGDGFPEIFVTGTAASGPNAYQGVVAAYEWKTNPLPAHYQLLDWKTWGDPAATTEGHGVGVGRLLPPPQTTTQVVAGGFTTVGGQKRGELSIWTWDGALFGPTYSQLWGVGGGDTAVNATYVGEVGGDAQLEIVTAGKAWIGLQSQAQVRVWHWTGVFTQMSRLEWIDGTSTGANSVFARDVDQDGVVEILVAGEAILPSGAVGELSISHWDGSSSLLNEETRTTWTVGGSTRAFGVYALDVEPDGVTEILTAGRDWDWTITTRLGQLRIWNWSVP